MSSDSGTRLRSPTSRVTLSAERCTAGCCFRQVESFASRWVPSLDDDESKRVDVETLRWDWSGKFYARPVAHLSALEVRAPVLLTLGRNFETWSFGQSSAARLNQNSEEFTVPK